MGKILILANSSSGLYDFRNELILRLLEENEVYVSLPDDMKNDLLEEEGCKVIEIPFERRGTNPVKDIKLLFAYRRLIKSIKPDCVLTYTIKPNIYGGVACRLTKTRYLCNVTGLGTALQRDSFISKILISMYKFGTAKADCIFFQNIYNQEYMQNKGIGVHNARLLPGSGVNLEKHKMVNYPSEDKGIRFLSIMRIMKDKGVEELFDSIERICTKYPGTTFEIAGAYEEETKEIYEPQVETLVKKGYLTYDGYIGDVSESLAGCSAIVHPSYHEGLSNVCLEAAATGRAVIATDVPGCKETYIDGETGIGFASRSKEALFGAIERFILLDSESREKMGINARKYVEENFSRKIVVEAYIEEIGRNTL